MERIDYTRKMTGRVSDSGGFTPFGERITGYKKLHKSDTIRRPRPADLFAGTTGRDVVSESYVGGLGRWPGYRSYDLVSNFDYYPCTIGLGGGLWSDGLLSDWNPLYSRLRGKIKGQTVNLAVTCAEYRSTCSMFSTLAGRIYSVARACNVRFAFANAASLVIRDRPMGKRRSAKVLTNEWLQFQYGIVPALDDLYGATAALASRVQEGIPIYMKVGDSSSRTKEGSSGHPDYYQSYRWTLSGLANRSVKARFVVRNSTLPELKRIGLTNVLAAGWELIPYSFVVDQIVPIGNYLSSIDALYGVEDLTVVRSKRVTQSITTQGRLGSVVGYHEAKNRSAAQFDIPMPSLRYEPSGSLKSVVNGLALLAQLRL